MDWDLKMPPWDLAELEPNAEPNVGPMVGSSSGGLGLDCSVDLKLGGLGDFGAAGENKWRVDRLWTAAATSMPSSSSSSSKRARALGNGSQNAACLVDGCKSDLSGCREYHRRHKVCEAHSKTPTVIVAGQEQRFCQQCSRFHLLVEFDEVKRSCRKRLDGHNRRRRKPQPEPISSGSIFSHHQATRFSSYPQIFPSVTAAVASDPSWPVIVKTEEDSFYRCHSSLHFLDLQHQHFSGSFSRSFREDKQFPFLQDGGGGDRPHAALEPSICQPLLKTIASAAESGSNVNGGKLFPEGLTRVLDSDCALSLLSSPPQSSAMNFAQIVQSTDSIPTGQPLFPYGAGLGLGRYSGPHQQPGHVSSTGFSCSGMGDGNADMNCHGLYGVDGEEGPSDGGSTHALPFSWQQ